LATVVAMSSGIGVSFWCGVACYGVALVSGVVASKAKAPEPAG
jgi:F0F1-type ATP synthase membrane subunit c/vacuolar-type H+-ATPase subunit K